MPRTIAAPKLPLQPYTSAMSCTNSCSCPLTVHRECAKSPEITSEITTRNHQLRNPQQLQLLAPAVRNHGVLAQTESRRDREEGGRPAAGESRWGPANRQLSDRQPLASGTDPVSHANRQIPVDRPFVPCHSRGCWPPSALSVSAQLGAGQLPPGTARTSAPEGRHADGRGAG